MIQSWIKIKKTIMKRIFTILLILSIAFSMKSQDLVNTCWETVSDGDIVSFYFKDSTFNYFEGTDTLALATYTSSLDTFRIIDLVGMSCDSTGTYSFSIENGQLDFTPIEDQCASRVAFLDSRIFYTCGTLTSVEEISEDAIQIFPNPTEDLFVIETEISFDEIQLVNQIGQIIKIVRDKKTLSLSEFAGNLFFIRCIIGDRIITKKVLKK